MIHDTKIPKKDLEDNISDVEWETYTHYQRLAQYKQQPYCRDTYHLHQHGQWPGPR